MSLPTSHPASAGPRDEAMKALVWKGVGEVESVPGGATKTRGDHAPT